MVKNLQYAEMSKQLKKNGWQCKKHLRCFFSVFLAVKTIKILKKTKIL